MRASEFTDALRWRKRYYRFAFYVKTFVLRKRRAYAQVFGKPAGQMVLQDLAKFCRAYDTTLNPGSEPTTLECLEGRRQVWLRIQRHLHLTPDQLFDLYKGATIEVKGVDEDG